MNQVLQYVRDGGLDIGEVPMPAIGPAEALVRNHYSCASVGTAKKKVSQARMSLMEKAGERPDQVYHIALGERITLNELFEAIRSLLEPRYSHLRDMS